MYWVVQDNMYNEEGYEKLISALERLEIPYSVHKVIPFVHLLQPDIDPEGEVMVMGAYTMSHIARDKGWIPGSFDNDTGLSYGRQIAKWGTHMFNYDADITTFKDVKKRYKPFFLRPVDDGKSFGGHVTDWKEFTEWQARVLAIPEMEQTTLSFRTPVLTSSVKKIYSETRTWIIEGEVITASEYKRGNRVKYSDQVEDRIIEYATERAQEWAPAQAYCMDIADTPDGLKILECGNINACGFYAADMMKLVHAMDNIDVW